MCERKCKCAAVDVAEISLKSNTSTNKMENILSRLDKKGYNVPTPSQSDIYKAADIVLDNHINSLKEKNGTRDDLTPHFDGKRMKNFYNNKSVELLAILIVVVLLSK